MNDTLSPKETAYIYLCYKLPEDGKKSDTFHKKGASALAAGYKEGGAKNAPARIMKKEVAQALKREIEEANYTAERSSVLSMLAYWERRAIDTDNITAGIKIADLRGRDVGMFLLYSDRPVDEEQKELDENQRKAVEDYEEFKRQQLLGFPKLKQQLREQELGEELLLESLDDKGKC